MSQSTTESSSQCDDELYVRETLFYYVCILLELNILLTFIHLCKFIGSHLLCVLSTMGKQAQKKVPLVLLMFQKRCLQDLNLISLVETFVAVLRLAGARRPPQSGAAKLTTLVGSTVYLQRQKSHALALDTGRISGSKQSTHLLGSHLHLSCHDLILHSNLLYLPDCSKPLLLLPCVRAPCSEQTCIRFLHKLKLTCYAREDRRQGIILY